jgi:3alpha(or 20beta)-hydroxysteroid dehydrogenase
VKRLADKIAVVTGGARGQGEAIARYFVDEGATVVIADVLDDVGEAVARDIGKQATYCHLDVADEDNWSRVVDTAVNRFGNIDILVNNAGVCEFALLTETTTELFDRIMDVNCKGVFFGMRSVGALMTSGRGGSIINTGSIDGLLGCAGLTAYSAAKFALRGMTKCAALEFAPNVRVNAICPGGIDTPMSRGSVPEGFDWDAFFQGVPMRRMAEPVEIAGLACYLASDESKFLTGTDIVFDGGQTAGFALPD